MKKLFAFVFLLLLSNTFAQTAYRFKGDFGEVQQEEILKSADSLFYFLPNIALNVSTNHLRPYKEIPVDKTYQPGYLEEQQKLLKQHPGDATVYNNIANYYQNKGDLKSAQENYTKALENLKLQPKAKDSASFYSLRAIIKLNLGQEGVGDIEKALAINKSDSISQVFYPLFLVGRQDFSKARKVVTDALEDKDNHMKDFNYIMLGMIEMYEVASKFNGLSDEETELLMNKDIAKIIDFDANDRYMDKKNPWYNRAKQMLGLFNGIIKYSQGLEPGGSFTPTQSDIAYMAAKEEYFKKVLKEKNASLYGAYFSLGIINYSQKKFTEANGYFEKALLSFPKDKEGFQFNTAEIYDNMAGVYYMQKNYAKVKEILLKKVALKSLNAMMRRDDYTHIAGICLEQNNLVEAETYAQLALEADDSFAANSMLAYISFKRNYGLSAEKYLQKAMAQISNQEEVCKALTMVAAIQLVNGSPDGAYSVYNDHKSYLEGYECDCEAMLERYVVE
ncbi:tetratricopeptide repeat protein [Flavobacterium sp. MFBS3-15]|uniref:tetratricopeptide repeat protein n=1 Tax=Flavobacterium sp. MFBS3-15 TaxID=2989816 RepID=UPI002235DE53|nr:tetratricopeptide repeat protein [Flavobacterium sp. MFBS3-15]MCW4467540.1 tetratricopeptide repeat protein [Flavobacterium sp. MFBS3-15]